MAGVTWFAQGEAATSRRAPLVVAAAVLNAGLLLFALFAARELVPALVPGLSRVAGPLVGGTTAPGTLALLGVIVFTIDRRVAAAVSRPEPARVQQAVKVMLLSLITLDAAMIYFKTGDPLYALATLALLMPAMLLGRWIFIT